ncbi:MAG: TolC family protein [Bacteroidetes bacterium]|nr:TolC family protein [Bacteroidota bacterium]
MKRPHIKTEQNRIIAVLLNRKKDNKKIKSIINVCLIGMTMSLTYPTWAQKKVTLDSILSVINTNHPMLKNYRYRAESMALYAEGATSLMAPEVGGGPWMLPYPGTKVMDQRDKGQMMLSVQQKFTNPAKLRANQSFLRSKTLLEKADEKYTFNELRALAKTAFYQWIVLEKKKKVLQENEAIIKLVLKISEVRYQYNQSKLGTIYKAQGRLSEVQNRMLTNDNEIIQKNIILNQLMNVSKEIRYQIDTTNHYRNFIPELPDTATFAQNRSDIKKIDGTIYSMRLNQQLERSQAKPDFTISYNHMFPLGSGMPGQYMLLGMVSIPIAPWSSKMYKSNVKGMEGQIEAMKYERESVLNELQGMTAGMVNEIETLREQVFNYEKKIIPALQKNYETLLLAYQENREELYAVMDAYEARLMAQIQYFDTLSRYFETAVNYEKLLEK